MARKAKKQTQTRKPTASADGPRTTEDLADDVLQSLAFQHKRKFDDIAEKKKDLAKAEKEAKTLAKAAMGADALEVIKDLQELETEEGEKKLTTAVRRILRSAKWAGSTLNTQFQMSLEPDRTPAVDRAFAEGKRDAFKDEPARCSYDPSTEQYRKYMEGHAEGRSTLNAQRLAAIKTPEQHQQDSEPKTFAQKLHDQNEAVRATMLTPAGGDKIGTAAPTHVTKQ